MLLDYPEIKKKFEEVAALLLEKNKRIDIMHSHKLAVLYSDRIDSRNFYI